MKKDIWSHEELERLLQYVAKVFMLQFPLYAGKSLKCLKVGFLHSYGCIAQLPIATVWKFQNFAITQILREINFGDSTNAKSAISTHFDVLNFACYEILHFLKAEIYQINKI